MNITFIIFLAICIILYVVAFLKGEVFGLQALKIGGMAMLKTIPLIIVAFAILGAIQVLIPKEFITKWLGAKTGMKGIFLGCVLGGITPGPPYISFPLALSLLKGGAGIGTVVAFITAWEIWSVERIPLEVAFLGTKFIAIRVVCTLIFPPLVGVIAHMFFRGVSL